jgi:hypothetical protein
MSTVVKSKPILFLFQEAVVGTSAVASGEAAVAKAQVFSLSFPYNRLVVILYWILCNILTRKDTLRLNCFVSHYKARISGENLRKVKIKLSL